MICPPSYADLLYINTNSSTINRLTLNASGKFTDTSLTSSDAALEQSSIFGFTHKGRSRVLLHDGNAFGNEIAIHDPADMSAPLGELDISSTGLARVRSLAEYGDNIIIAGNGQVYANGEMKEQGAILEIDPETCSIVETYRFGEITNYQPDINAWVGVDNSAEVFTLNGNIYATIEEIINNQWGGVTYEMDGLGNITKTLDDLPSECWLKPIDGKLYVSYSSSDGGGIYRMGDDLQFSHAEKVISADTFRFCSDGNGGLYYELVDPERSRFPARWLYHWDGKDSTMIYDTGRAENGLERGIGTINFDSQTQILAVMSGVSNNGTEQDTKLLLFTPDANGNMTLTHTIENIDSLSFTFTNSDNLTPQSPTPSPSETLPTALIEPAAPSELTPQTLANIAEAVSIDVSAVKFLTQSDLSEPQDPTQAISDAVREDGYSLTHRLNTITVNETGYYVFWVNVPEELQGMKADDVRLYLADRSIFAASLKSAALPAGILSLVELDSLGLKLDTLPEKILAVGLLKAGTPFSVYLAKIIIALLAGGCSLSGAGALLLCGMAVLFVRR